jgi:O-succinylhomoserine sulfhydrylase
VRRFHRVNKKIVKEEELERSLGTRAVRVGQYPDMSDAHCEPIAVTSAYVFASAEDAAQRFSGAKSGNVYSRFTNPTVRAFEQRLASLEAAEDAVAFASGMAAITGIAHAWLSAGKNVVCSRDVFGTTLTAFRYYFGKLGVEVRVASLTQHDEWKGAIDERTGIVFLETPSNPVQQVGDIESTAAIAHAAGALLVVDNTALTPIQQNPLAHGADLVVHSAGKYIDGQGRCVAGVVAGPERLTRELRSVIRALGSSLGAMDAWMLLKSLEMLELRVRAIGDSAMQLALWLQERRGVRNVFYTGLPTHPQFALACRQQRGHGGVLSFEVGQAREDAWRMIDSLSLVSIATNIGDTRTMITHPASTTHGRLSPEDRRLARIGENLVRLSVGLEHVEDLIADIDGALTAMETTSLRRHHRQAKESA